MAIYDIFVFDAVTFVNGAGNQGFDDDETNNILLGPGPYALTGGGRKFAQVDDRSFFLAQQRFDFDDGTSEPQTLETPLTLTYVQDGVTRTTTFPPTTTQIQAEFKVEFASGYTLVAIRLTDPNSAATGDNLVTAGYSLVPPPGGAVPPPVDPVTGRFELGPVTGGNPNGTTDYADIPCFAAGTLIGTPDGARKVEGLRVGDHVTTADHGAQPVAWVGAVHLPQARLIAAPHLQPIRFAPHVLGTDRALTLSPQHRVLVGGGQVDLLYGHEEVLVPACAWIGQPGVTRVLPQDGITYVHFACARHEVIEAEGGAMETLLPAAGPGSHMSALWAELNAQGVASMTAARPILHRAEAQALFAGMALAA